MRISADRATNTLGHILVIGGDKVGLESRSELCTPEFLEPTKETDWRKSGEECSRMAEINYEQQRFTKSSIDLLISVMLLNGCE